jgi:uncharacterized membrane protein YphA (DoxX/SURF4 family)
MTQGRLSFNALNNIRRRFAVLRLTLGAVWLVDGLLQLQPSVFRNFLTLIQEAGQNQPAPLQASIAVVASLITRAPALTNVALGAAEVLIGLALLIGVGGRRVLIASMALTVPIWVFGEGLGQVFSGSTTDIGAAPLYAALALAVLCGQGWKELNLVPALARRSDPAPVYRVEGIRGFH